MPTVKVSPGTYQEEYRDLSDLVQCELSESSYARRFEIIGNLVALLVDKGVLSANEVGHALFLGVLGDYTE